MVRLFRFAATASLLAAALVSAAPTGHSHSQPSLEKRGWANVITRCKIPGTLAITFDDGPWFYTTGLLDILKSRAVKATFFFNGIGWGHIDYFADAVKKVYEDGHQVASHTWDHKDLATLSESEVIAEMTQWETLDILGQLNYTAVIWDVDTNDWAHPTDFDASYKIYEALFNNTEDVKQPGHIVLNHETHMVTALRVAPMVIDLALVKGYKVVTVGECMGDPKSNWYKP
ncbi:chitin deacetylase [Actinomortierella ambigua]|nr:chitin deacetylase [Actinomortierella ambigua]